MVAIRYTSIPDRHDISSCVAVVAGAVVRYVNLAAAPDAKIIVLLPHPVHERPEETYSPER